MNTELSPFDYARNCWLRMGQFRSTRERLKRFTYGRQWEELVPEGTNATLITEGEAARRAGRRPLTNNLLRSLVKSIVGRFRHVNSSLTVAEELREIHRANRLDELDARALEEFLISGCAVQRVVTENRFDGQRVWVDNVIPSRFFCNRYLDPRGSDIRLVGMLHDMSSQEIHMRFSHGSRRRAIELQQIFSASSPFRPVTSLAAVDPDCNVTWEHTGDPSLFRVIEVWTFEHVRHHGAAWCCRFYTPEGTLIDESRSPFAHRSHPFVVTLYPLTDGEVHPFIEDVIDQQRHINRLVTTIDQILNNSAKGVLLFPTDALDGQGSIEEAAELWNKPSAVIPVNPRARNMPREIISSGRSEGAAALLDIEFRLFRQISGVSQAMQGEAPSGRISASLYDTQVANSTVALMDIYASFDSFRAARDEKALGI